MFLLDFRDVRAFTKARQASGRNGVIGGVNNTLLCELLIVAGDVWCMVARC